MALQPPLLQCTVSSQGFLAISTGAGRYVAELQGCDGDIGRRGENSSLEDGGICSY